MRTTILLQKTKALANQLIAKSKEGYTTSNGQVIPPWIDAFVDYFEHNIYPDFDALAAYSVQKICPIFFNSFSGLTSNGGEGINNLLKVCNDRTDLPLDVVVLSCFQLSIYYCNEIKLGFGSEGINLFSLDKFLFEKIF